MVSQLAWDYSNATISPSQPRPVPFSWDGAKEAKRRNCNHGSLDYYVGTAEIGTLPSFVRRTRVSRNGSSGEHRTDGADKVRGHRVLLGEPSSQESYSESNRSIQHCKHRSFGKALFG